MGEPGSPIFTLVARSRGSAWCCGGVIPVLDFRLRIVDCRSMQQEALQCSRACGVSMTLWYNNTVTQSSSGAVKRAVQPGVGAGLPRPYRLQSPRIAPALHPSVDELKLRTRRQGRQDLGAGPLDAGRCWRTRGGAAGRGAGPPDGGRCWRTRGGAAG